MKKIFFLLVSSLTLFNCTSRNTKNESDSIPKIEFTAVNFVGSTVGYENDDKIELGITPEELIKSFNNYSEMADLGYKAMSYEIERIEGENYIRFFNEDGSISTIALINDKLKSKNSSANIFTLGRTVCTTTACANCCGCVPHGDYCTHCDINTLDCKRTTSNPPPPSPSL